jgi:hypothetical protein
MTFLQKKARRQFVHGSFKVPEDCSQPFTYAIKSVDMLGIPDTDADDRSEGDLIMDAKRTIAAYLVVVNFGLQQAIEYLKLTIQESRKLVSGKKLRIAGCVVENFNLITSPYVSATKKRLG